MGGSLAHRTHLRFGGVAIMSEGLSGGERERVVTYTYDVDGSVCRFAAGDGPERDPLGGAIDWITYEVSTPPPVRFEHDPEARVFRLTTADGTVEVFRDNPTRYLCVEPDPQQHGAMRPVRGGEGGHPYISTRFAQFR